ncbi:MAG: aldo/keto reductase [Bacteroidota bacterium]
MKYTLLGNTGLKVSELCLGTMGFGTEWNWGADYETSQKILNMYIEAGGNFIDTANLYTENSSEKFLGEMLHGNRHDMVLATKYALRENRANKNINASGNNRKSLMYNVEQSLKRLRTDYIDLLYLHAWDGLTPIDEVMRGLDDLVSQGKVNYLGISDTPAWVVAQGQTLAQYTGLTKFATLQVEYSLLQRTPERELIPMMQHFGMTLTPWAPLAGGALTGKYLKGDKGRLPEESTRLNERSVSITKEVLKISEETGFSPSHVALRWVMQKPYNSIPIIGATKPHQLEDNLNAINVSLTNEHIVRLNAISAIEMGFPHDFLLGDGVKDILYSGQYDNIKRR